MVKKDTPDAPDSELESDEVFELAAEVFRVMSAPMRLKIISALCNGEKNVGELLADIHTTQPNMSQHLNTLYKAGVLGRRRDGVQIYYRIIYVLFDDPATTECYTLALHAALPTWYSGQRHCLKPDHGEKRHPRRPRQRT